ncbi:unnamed protein product [Caenorhabditis bovis]|uniref:Uncharacterized protein n=1 Tax=Caenorhabditis bovis TaxID=2654633 RepID=A0A8S1FAD3_9PELO|nr:unnamed protein product [Caenorhabditis bovis]
MEPSGASTSLEAQANIASNTRRKRRSSIGTELLSAFLENEKMDKIETPERMTRPVRKTVLAARYRMLNTTKEVLNRRRKLSMDIGERPLNLKSCFNNKCKLAQKTAKKLVSKYRRSRSMSATPSANRRRSLALRFHEVCTIRVITPRSDYNPAHLKLPTSDDEGDCPNPQRQRLSTVKLDITPTSKAYLESIKDKENANIQFNASMVFGDDGYPESDIVSTDSGPSSSASKRRRKRKSLVFGAGSPLKVPDFAASLDDTKIEDAAEKAEIFPLFKSSTPEPQLKEPKRRARRSVKIEAEKPVEDKNVNKRKSIAKPAIENTRKTRRRTLIKTPEVIEIDDKPETPPPAVPQKDWFRDCDRSDEEKPHFPFRLLSASESSDYDILNGIQTPPEFSFDPTYMDIEPAWDELVEGKDEMLRVIQWLRRWKKKVRRIAQKEQEAELNSKKKKVSSSAKKSKKYRDDDDEDDEDYEGSDEEELENPLILIGPTGVGKSAFISSLAKAENMKIVGMGPEVERNGMAIRSKLTEAMKSHRVNTQQPSGLLVRFFANERVEYRKKDNDGPKKEASKCVLDTDFAQSLVVFEHVDLLFGNLDRHAATALIDLANTAAVPVVWTCDSEYPRSAYQAELEKSPLLVHLRRRNTKVRNYVQKMVQESTGIEIDDDSMNRLAKSVNYDLRGLIQQAKIFAFVPDKPLPLGNRYLINAGFDTVWQCETEKSLRETLKEQAEARKLLVEENLIATYTDIYKIAPDGLIRFPKIGIERLHDNDEINLCKKMSQFNENYELGYRSFSGRFSKKSMITDVLPILEYAEEVEKKRKMASRRHQHRFTAANISEYSLDDEGLMQALARIRTLSTS